MARRKRKFDRNPIHDRTGEPLDQRPHDVDPEAWDRLISAHHDEWRQVRSDLYAEAKDEPTELPPSA